MIDTSDLAAELVFRQRQAEETYRKLEAQFQADFAKIEWPIAFLEQTLSTRRMFRGLA
jgi:hypothetical protein